MQKNLLSLPAAGLRQAGRAALTVLGLALAAPVAQAQASFATAVTYAANGYAQGIVAADFNGDGRPDLATSNSADGTVGVLLNSATAVGTFLPVATYGANSSFAARLAAGDVNNDGRPDVAVITTYGTSVSVLLNSATTPGSLATGVAYSTGGTPVRGIALADVNGDGRLDLVLTNDSSVGVMLGLAAAPGTFGPVALYSTGASTIFALKVGDFNGGNRPDIAATVNNNNAVLVLLNQASAPGTFGNLATYSTNSNLATSDREIDLGDMNNDGRLDMVVANTSSATVSVLLNSAAAPGTFAAGTVYSTGSPNNAAGLAVGDLTGDGLPDLAVANRTFGNTNTTVSVLVNASATPGTFPTAPTIVGSGGSGPVQVTIRDLNADGRPDLAVSNIDARTVGVLLNTGTTFPAPVLTALSPVSGPVGTSVTITGTALSGTTAVSFNGTAATSFSVVSSTSVTASVPAGATTGLVKVTANGQLSNGLTFTVTIPAATVTTAAAANVTSTSALLGGAITFEGGAAVTERGVVYSATNQVPTTASAKVSNGSGLGSFNQVVSGLLPATTYYVRAYGTNSGGTGYGPVVSFTTLQGLATAASLAAAEITLHPNPAHDSFTLTVPAVAGAATVRAELLNALGQVVQRQSAALPATGARLTVPTAGLPAGVYSVRVQAGTESVVRRTVIY